MEITTYSNFRQNLKAFLDKVLKMHEPLYIKRCKGEDIVILSKQDYESLQETFYLLKNPKNAESILKGLQDYNNNKGQEQDLIEE